MTSSCVPRDRRPRHEARWTPPRPPLHLGRHVPAGPLAALVDERLRELDADRFPVGGAVSALADRLGWRLRRLWALRYEVQWVRVATAERALEVLGEEWWTVYDPERWGNMYPPERWPDVVDAASRAFEGEPCLGP